MNVNVLEARNNLSQLLKYVEANPSEVVTISRRGVPIVDLVIHERSGGIAFDLAAEQYQLPDDWDMHDGDAEVAALMGV